MIEKSVAKIKAEMDQKPKNSYVNVVGNFLIQHLQNNPEDAERIIASDKNVEKSLDEMRKVAESKKIGNCAVLTDEEGFAIILKYFGLKGAGKLFKIELITANIPIKTETVTPKKSDKAFEINLDDLLGKG